MAAQSVFRAPLDSGPQYHHPVTAGKRTHPQGALPTADGTYVKRKAARRAFRLLNEGVECKKGKVQGAPRPESQQALSGESTQ